MYFKKDLFCGFPLKKLDIINIQVEKGRDVRERQTSEERATEISEEIETEKLM